MPEILIFPGNTPAAMTAQYTRSECATDSPSNSSLIHSIGFRVSGKK
jgi:hypothetical protein